MKDTEFNALERDLSKRDGPGGSLILLVSVMLFGALLIWASRAELDNVTRGDGRLISSAQNQTVQASEGGVILRRLVTENTRVSAGDPLYEIDPVEVSSELNRLTRRLLVLDLRERRLIAERDGLELRLYDQAPDAPDTLVRAEEELLRARRSELSGRVSLLQQRRLQGEQAVAETEAQVRTTERTVLLLEEEIRVVEPLVEQNLAPTVRLLELRRQLEAARGERERLLVSKARAETALREAETEMRNAEEAFRLRAVEEINEVVAEREELQQMLPPLRERVSRTLVRSPVDGVVSRVNFRTEGGFVQQGDALLELVPTGESLIVQARISPKDISNVREGDLVRIRLSAYDSSRYGTLDGRLTRISPDAVQDESGGTYYLVDVHIEGELQIGESGQVAELIPGMTATVDVISGTRTVLEYVWQPVARVQELALRD